MKKEKYKMAGYNKVNVIIPGVFIWGVFCVFLIITAICADSLAPYDAYEQNLSEALMPPGALHIAGTDQYCRGKVISAVITVCCCVNNIGRECSGDNMRLLRGSCG